MPASPHLFNPCDSLRLQPRRMFSITNALDAYVRERQEMVISRDRPEGSRAAYRESSRGRPPSTESSRRAHTQPAHRQDLTGDGHWASLTLPFSSRTTMVAVPPWMSAPTFEYVLQFTEAHEGKTNFMYNNYPAKSPTQDITVGVGISLRTEEDAVRPDIMGLFRRKSDNAPATDTDMRTEFKRVAKLERTQDNLFTVFGDPSPLYIPLPLMRPSLRTKILTFWDSRGNSPNFPDFATIPAQAQVALMSWNYGARISNAPKMCKAIKDGDYHAAAMQSNMPGWDPQKNVAHRVLLLNAGVIVRDGLPLETLPPMTNFKPPPPTVGQPEADLSWLYGWWTVYDGSYYYYYFGPNGSVSWVETKPNRTAPAPTKAGNRGTYFFERAGKMIVDWTELGGASTKETFHDANAGTTAMNATSNRYASLYAVKL